MALIAAAQLGASRRSHRRACHAPTWRSPSRRSTASMVRIRDRKRLLAPAAADLTGIEVVALRQAEFEARIAVYVPGNAT